MYLKKSDVFKSFSFGVSRFKLFVRVFCIFKTQVLAFFLTKTSEPSQSLLSFCLKSVIVPAGPKAITRGGIIWVPRYSIRISMSIQEKCRFAHNWRTRWLSGTVDNARNVVSGIVGNAHKWVSGGCDITGYATCTYFRAGRISKA